ncbi:hypothetical protein [Alkaliphilus hydrothermalis]|uniref:K+-transporting ATPase A subunit n=1 Tax=Alkaliphilus hydrothermalis TaxID=1482730 RepID=A0ABS2NQL0_9FIRM|nr:hypothetical protein [Alkaliphilus hydrothermalis]MBM7615245.1 K+-transporting ATPase A subunit [Alkaliphilus hydrothermalis]
MFQTLLNKTKKTLVLSISSILLLSILAVIYSLIKQGAMLKNVFNFNYVIACIIVVYGLLSFFVPINLKKSNRLVDHSNYAQVHREEKEDKLTGAMESLWWGISNILLVGIIEVILRSL